MKTKLFISSLVIFFFMAMGQQAFAQIDDSLPPWFKAPIDMITLDNGIKSNFTFLLSPALKKTAKPISLRASKSMMLPRSVKRLPSPITVKRNGKCYKIGCDPKSCDNCQLFWFDRNRDGKVQLGRELRCYCPKTRKQCKMRGKEISCKK